MEHTTTNSGSAARTSRGPARTNGPRVLLHLPDLTPRPGRPATTKPATGPASSKPAEAAKAPPASSATLSGPSLSVHKPSADKSTTTTIHAAHAGPRPSQATAAPSSAKLPQKSTKSAPSKPSSSKPKPARAQPFLLLILVGIACGVLVGVIATRANKPTVVMPDEPPPAWISIEADPSTNANDAESVQSDNESGPSLGRSAPATNESAAKSSKKARPAAVEPRISQRPIFDKPFPEAPRDEIPGVARLNGRIEVESHGGTQR